MLQTFLHVLNAQRNVLASGSPRRKEILEKVDLKFEVIPSTFEENVDKSKVSSPQEYVLETARLKLEEVASRLGNDLLPDMLIGADTVVSQDSRIIEKPKDKEDAVSILTSLSGRSHFVFTGVVLAFPSNSNVFLPHGKTMLNGRFRYTTFVESTEVFMADLSSQIIQSYVDTGEAMDKAGGYGIQRIGGTMVEKIHGDFFNVMGFPLPRFAKELAQIYGQYPKKGD